jgi:flagellar motor component MotA
LRERFFGNMSNRVRSFIEEEMEFREPISLGEIEDAQQRIILTQWRLTSPAGKKTRKSKPQEVSERLKAMAQEGQRCFSLPLSQLSIDQVMTVLVSLSELSLREGIRALEEAGVEDDFVKEALQLAIDGFELDLLVDLLETRLQTLSDQQKTRYRVIIEGMLAIAAGDNPGIVQHKLHTCYMPGLGKDYVPRKVSVAEVRGKLKRQPFSQRNFDEITEVFTDMAIISRREGIRRLTDLMDLIDDELLKQALQLATAEMEWRSMVDPLETRMKDLLEKHDVRYRMVIEGICAIQKGKDPSTVEEEMKEVAQV